MYFKNYRYELFSLSHYLPYLSFYRYVVEGEKGKVLHTQEILLKASILTLHICNFFFFFFTFLKKKIKEESSSGAPALATASSCARARSRTSSQAFRGLIAVVVSVASLHERPLGAPELRAPVSRSQAREKNRPAPAEDLPGN